MPKAQKIGLCFSPSTTRWEHVDCRHSGFACRLLSRIGSHCRSVLPVTRSRDCHPPFRDCPTNIEEEAWID